jgi:hypothetical protein
MFRLAMIDTPAGAVLPGAVVAALVLADGARS